MGTLALFSLRALLIWYIFNALADLVDELDKEAKTLQKKIEFWRKWNERIGMHVIELETRHRELVQ